MSLPKNLIKCIKIFLDISDKSEKEMVYLETGLDQGNSVKDVLTNFNFKKIISIEIDKIKIDKVKQRLQYENDYSKIIFIEGDSSIKLREIYDQSTDIIFLDAHGKYTDTDPSKIFPLEEELKFLIDKADKHQLIIIDDFIKIRNNHLFKNELDWRSHYEYKDFKLLLNEKGFKKLEIFYDTGMNSCMLLTKNKKFKIDIKLYLVNISLKFQSIRFYFFWYKLIILRYLKKIVIFLSSENFWYKLKNFIKKNN
tara:strand:- start:582 stop:1340 length:759 start_codon:yes stop_codon:yes gene_type:complete